MRETDWCRRKPRQGDLAEVTRAWRRQSFSCMHTHCFGSIGRISSHSCICFLRMCLHARARRSSRQRLQVFFAHAVVAIVLPIPCFPPYGYVRMHAFKSWLAASVVRRGQERLARAVRGMRACRIDARAAAPVLFVHALVRAMRRKQRVSASEYDIASLCLVSV